MRKGRPKAALRPHAACSGSATSVPSPKAPRQRLSAPRTGPRATTSRLPLLAKSGLFRLGSGGPQHDGFEGLGEALHPSADGSAALVGVGPPQADGSEVGSRVRPFRRRQDGGAASGCFAPTAWTSITANEKKIVGHATTPRHLPTGAQGGVVMGRDVTLRWRSSKLFAVNDVEACTHGLRVSRHGDASSVSESRVGARPFDVMEREKEPRVPGRASPSPAQRTP